MTHTADISRSIQQTTEFLGQVGLKRVALGKQESSESGAVWIEAKAKLPVGTNPTADWHRLQERMDNAIKPDGERLVSTGAGPKEIYTYADGSFTVVHGKVRMHVSIEPARAFAAVQATRPQTPAPALETPAVKVKTTVKPVAEMA